MRTLRANLIRTAWEHPQLRRPILALLREARTYDEYVKDKDSKGEKPKSKKDWEAYGKGQERLESGGGKLDKLRANLGKSFTDEQFDALVTRAKDMKPKEVEQFLQMAKDGDTEAMGDWAEKNLPDSVQKWVDDQSRESEQRAEKGEDEEGPLFDFGLGLLDWISETVDRGKG